MENSGLFLIPADLLRRIHDFLETIEEWVGWDYQDECERLEGEIEEILNHE